MQRRQNHYMKAPMLQSQFGTLEEPVDVLTCDITQDPQQIVDTIVEHLLLGRRPA
jgi:gluconokinase